MRAAARRRFAGRRQGAVGGNFRPDAHKILTITNDGTGQAMVTIESPYSFNAESIVISGSSVSGYNTTTTVLSIGLTTQFSTGLPYTADATGGTWALA